MKGLQTGLCDFIQVTSDWRLKLERNECAMMKAIVEIKVKQIP